MAKPYEYYNGKGTNKYEDYVERGKRTHGNRFDASELAPQFVKPYNNGDRIKVQLSHGAEITGTVGVTTGWRPCFLLMRTNRSISSPWTLGADDKIIAVWNGRKYVDVQ